MKHGEAPWFLMWSSALLFSFGMVWAWLADIGAAKTVAVLDTPVRSALLIGAGALGTILGQFGMLLAWRRYMRATEETTACRAGSEIIGRAAAPSATTGEACSQEAPRLRDSDPSGTRVSA